jgi:hypothetical protein
MDRRARQRLSGYEARGETVCLKRLVWEPENGPIPEGAVVISTCGERTCIEPSHLALTSPGRYASVRDALGRYASNEEGARYTGPPRRHSYVLRVLSAKTRQNLLLPKAAKISGW